ncbi:MAG: pentapeptide repeat-containing protein [Bdellovibrionaceae bacterium]|nr:pentapeptide repeat-containing protein [Pseudobdellovibrionaceae bacterium]
MKLFKTLMTTTLLIFGTLSISKSTQAAGPNMNTIYVQGYLRKATGSSVTDGNYAMVFSIRSGATYFWTKTITSSVSNGFFSQPLSGASSAPYAGSIDSTSLASAATGALAVNVQTTVDGQAVSFDVQASPVPLALLADKANSVAAAAIDTTALAAGAVTSAKIASATIQSSNLSATGTLPAWDGSALTNITAGNLSGTLPALSGATLTNLPAANLTGTLPAISGANLTNLSAANLVGTLPTISGATLTNLPAANLTGTLPAISGANLTLLPAANLTGTLAAISGVNLTNLNAANLTGTISAISGANLTALNATNITTGTLASSIFPATITTTGAFTVQSATGLLTTIGNTGGAGSTKIQAGTGKILVQSNAITGIAFSAMGACTITSFTCTAGANTAKTCTGVPSTAAAVFCSPASGGGTNNPTWGVFPTAANTVTLNSSAACTVASAWNCSWLVP